MIIELMLVLVVVGAGMIFVAWSNTRRRKQDALERREVENSTGKLKKELERTATEIIGRIENHVAHIESILDDSEHNRTQLEGRVAELKKLLKKAEGQSIEIRDLLARLEDTGAEVEVMQRKMENLERKLNIIMSTPIPVQQPVAIPQMTPPIINPIITPPIPSAPISTMPVNNPITPITPPINKPLVPPVQITTTPPAPPMNPLGPITMPSAMRTSNADKDFEEILEETVSEPPKSEERLPRESIVLSPENKQPVKAVEADPVKIEATRKRLTEASAEMAANPPEEISEVEEDQANDLKKKRAKRSKRDVRKAAIEAIKAVEKQNELESKPVAESKKISPPEKPKPIEKKEQVPERRDLKLETTDSAIIKEMLLAGMSIEEIARETGLGRGAIELIQEMTRRQLDRK